MVAVGCEVPGRESLLPGCRNGLSPVVESGDGGRCGRGGTRGDLTEYLIAFNGGWAPEHTDEGLLGKSRALRPLLAEMKEAGVLIFTGGLDEDATVFSVDASSGTPLCTVVETTEYLGGFAVVDVADQEAARLWAGRIAVACGWPQEVRRFQVPRHLPDSP